MKIEKSLRAVGIFRFVFPIERFLQGLNFIYSNTINVRRTKVSNWVRRHTHTLADFHPYWHFEWKNEKWKRLWRFTERKLFPIPLFLHWRRFGIVCCQCAGKLLYFTRYSMRDVCVVVMLMPFTFAFAFAFFSRVISANLDWKLDKFNIQNDVYNFIVLNVF